MFLAGASYATVIGGWLNTALLAVIGGGVGFFFRSLINNLKETTVNLVKLERRQERTETRVAILLDRDVRRHDSLSDVQAQALRSEDEPDRL